MARRRKDQDKPEAVAPSPLPHEIQRKLSAGIENLGEGDNNRFTQKNLQIFSMDKVDLENPDEVVKRLEQYFTVMGEYNAKPSVTSMAMALGIDRRRLWDIKTGRTTPRYSAWLKKLPPETIETIRRAYDLLEMMWEDYMLNGKINPVSGIFLGKNQFGYQDRTEHVLTPNQPAEEEFSSKEIKARYLLDDDDD